MSNLQRHLYLKLVTSMEGLTKLGKTFYMIKLKGLQGDKGIYKI